jgi:peptidoglycan/xylan/chitin deacetylase (PgdA/CDA1 family)
MYHYVRPDASTPPFDYYHLHLDDFRRQLDHFATEYGFVDRSEFDRFISGERSDAPDGVVLTFDDGLRDHYEYVYPELQSRGLWGIFFVSTEPYVERKLLDVHRVHLLLGSRDGGTLLNTLQDTVDEGMVADDKREAFKERAYSAQSGAEETKEAKRMLNLHLSREQRRRVLTRLEEALSIETDVSEYYTSLKQLKDMADDGMMIGAHTVTHPVLSDLSVSGQRREILDALEFLSDELKTTVDTFCYPYGKDYVYTEETLSILRSTDVQIAFTTEVGDVSTRSIKQAPYELPRRDCASFPHGEASGMTGS